MNLRFRLGHQIWNNILVVGLSGISCLPAFGVEFKSGENVTIEKSETVDDDVYMTGDTMTIKGRVIGDVVAAGRVLRIEGVVEGDLIAAGQAIVIEGEVMDDVRIAGMTLKLAEGSRVGDDMFAAGFSFESEPGSQVVGKTGFSGYQAVLGGEHRQGLEASLVGLRLGGRIHGDVDATVESEAGPAWWSRFMRSPVALPVVIPGLEIGEGAWIDGDIRYRSVAQAAINPGAQVTGEVDHSVPKVEAVEGPSWPDRARSSLRWLVVLVLLGWALIWLLPDKLLGMADTLAARPAGSLGWGAVTFLGFPITMLLVLVLTSVMTMAFGMLTLGQGAALTLVLGLVAELLLAAKLWVASCYLAPIITGLAVGRWLMSRRSGLEPGRYLSLVAGLVVVLSLMLIPFVGILVRVLVVAVGLGAGALWSVRYLARTDSP